MLGMLGYSGIGKMTLDARMLGMLGYSGIGKMTL